MKVSLFYLPSVGIRAEIERGMAGLRGELYDRMLAELSEQSRLADEVGYDSISFTEHHFRVEGFELSNNAVLLDLFVAMQTQGLRGAHRAHRAPWRPNGGNPCDGLRLRRTPR